ncbi:MAG TPA: RNA-binding S4 domain-containing protein [Anaerolineae bacterium]|nr:RNA-binding S4 domain-containing protein [Anaerolineae bacterium]HOR00212.1 RNA-binding S4 domain-containing protein [Anaerolineae bacterium]HPL30280.1 RNA-binding S4 domain-containing protein [Anaerolineae bacterium]
MAECERTIQLDQFLKWQGLVATGGEAKVRIQAGEVQVNGQVETRRSHKLRAGDVVTFEGRPYTVHWDEPAP